MASEELRVLLDTNVVLDVLARREPHFQDAARIWAAVETGHIEGLIAAHCVTTVFYLLSRHMNRQRATAATTDLLRLFEIASVNHEVLLSALALGWRDFEDAVQMSAAASAGATHLVTRNPDDFAGGPLPLLQPAELLVLIKASHEA